MCITVSQKLRIMISGVSQQPQRLLLQSIGLLKLMLYPQITEVHPEAGFTDHSSCCHCLTTLRLACWVSQRLLGHASKQWLTQGWLRPA